MIVTLVTRCDCRKTIEIDATEPPPGIQVALDLPEGCPETNRRFSYVGDHKIHQTPCYLEDSPVDPVEKEDHDEEVS